MNEIEGIPLLTDETDDIITGSVHRVSSVVSVMKLKVGNIAPRAGIEPASPALRASGPTTTTCHQSLAVFDLPEKSVQTTFTHPPGIASILLLTITYIGAGTVHKYIHRVGSITIPHITCISS